MIRWLVQTIVDHTDLAAGRPPAGLLAPQEVAEYETYLSPRRRRDWLLGRWTAKQLVQTHIAATRGFCPTPDSFTIAYEPSGAPTITSLQPALYDTSDNERVPLSLSISHSNGYAFCAVSQNGWRDGRIGADIELVASRPSSFADDFFTEAEQANLDAAPCEWRDSLMTATWSIKEAALKAAHIGLRADPRDVECLLRPVRPRSWTPVRVQLQPNLRGQAGVPGPLRVWWRVVDNRLRPGTHFVLTIAAFGTNL